MRIRKRGEREERNLGTRGKKGERKEKKKEEGQRLAQLNEPTDSTTSVKQLGPARVHLSQLFSPQLQFFRSPSSSKSTQLFQEEQRRFYSSLTSHRISTLFLTFNFQRFGLKKWNLSIINRFLWRKQTSKGFN